MVSRLYHCIFLLLLITSITGCTHSGETYGKITLVYATDRVWNGKSGEYFGGGRTGVTFGTCEVGVMTGGRPTPTSYVLNRLPTEPASGSGILEEPKRIHKPADTPDARMQEMIRNAVKKAPKKEILIFVHGFNVPYPDACFAAAQFAYDVGFEGVPMVFDWPSEGQLFGYFADEESAEWVVPHLSNFLRLIQLAAPDAKIELISHSLGSRVVTGMLRDLEYNRYEDVQNMLGHIVYVAPDIDVDIFRETSMGNKIHEHGIYTVYGSSADQALSLSKWLHHHKREGERPDQNTIDNHKPQWFQSVDASKVNTSELGHSYYDGDVAQVMLDLQALLRDDVSHRTAVWNSDNTFLVLSAPHASAGTK